MATITANASGDFSAGGTWVGGVVPGTSDTAVVPTGKAVTVSDVRTVAGWTLEGSGQWLITGTGHLNSTGYTLVQGDSTVTFKIVIDAGGKLTWDATGGDITPHFGNATFVYAGIQANGTQASPCYIGKKTGTTGNIFLRMHADGYWLQGFLNATWTTFKGLGNSSSDAVDFTIRWHGHMRLFNCTIDADCGRWNIGTYDSDPASYPLGGIRIEDTKFNNAANADTLTVQGNGDNTTIAVIRCDIANGFTTSWPGGAAPGELTLTDNIFRGVTTVNWKDPYDKIVSSGHYFYFEGPSTSGTYLLKGTHDQCYFFTRFMPDFPGEGNPHFLFITGGSCLITNSVFEYHGNYVDDTGDAMDLNGADAVVVLERCIILPSNVPGRSSGAIWWLGSNAGAHIRLRHCTIYSTDGGGVRFSHNTTMAAGCIDEVKSCIFWSDLEGASDFAFYADSPLTSAVDALVPSGVTANAFIGLATGTNTVGGVSTPLVGFEACEFSAAPTGNIVIASVADVFVDRTRNVLSWAAVDQGLTGTPDEILDDAEAAILANPSLVGSSLVPYVFDGFGVILETLHNAGHDGETIGASGDGAEELVDLDPDRLAFWESTIVQRHSSGSLPYVAGTGYNANQSEHYDVIRCMQAVRDYNIRKLRTPTDWSVQIAAGITRYRDRYILTDAAGGLIPGHVTYTTGLLHHWLENDDPLDIQAIDQIRPLDNGYIPIGDYESYYRERNDNPYFQRETAYRVKAYLDRRRAGLPKHQYQNVDVDLVFNFFDHFKSPPSVRYGAVTRSFMVGMALRSLISYWDFFQMEAVPDAEEEALMNAIPGQVKDILDHLWSKCWWTGGVPRLAEYHTRFWEMGTTKNTHPSNTDPGVQTLTGFTIDTVINAKEFIGAGALSSIDDYYKYLIYASDSSASNPERCVLSYNGTTKHFVIGGQDANPVDGEGFTLQVEDVSGKDWASPALNLLIAHAYAWYYWFAKVVDSDTETGLIYRSRHDQMFNGAYTAWEMPFSQKEWNQSVLTTPEALLVRDQADAGIDYRDLVEAPDTVSTYTLAGPSSGYINGVSGNFTVTLGAGEVTGTIRCTPMASGGTGIFVPGFLDLTDSVRSGTFTYIPSSLGSRVISSPDNAGLADPGGIAFESVAIPPVEPSPNQAAPFIPGDSVVIIGGVGGERVLIIPWDGKR